MTLGEELVAVLNDLMSTTDEVHVVLLQETRYYVWAEREADTSIVLTPTGDVLIRIGPQQIAEKSAIRNLPMSAFALEKLDGSS